MVEINADEVWKTFKEDVITMEEIVEEERLATDYTDKRGLCRGLDCGHCHDQSEEYRKGFWEKMEIKAKANIKGRKLDVRTRLMNARSLGGVGKNRLEEIWLIREKDIQRMGVKNAHRKACYTIRKFLEDGDEE